MKTVYIIFKCYIFVEVLHSDRDGKLLLMFTIGNIIAMPFIIATMSRKALSTGARSVRIAPEIASGRHVHPNTVGIRFMFSFFANLITFFRTKSKHLKTCNLCYCIIALCFVLLSGARSCALALIVSFMFLLFTVWRKHLLPFIGFVTVFMIVLYIAMDFLISSGVFMENPILKRMAVETALKDRGSGRLDVWYDYYRNTSLKELATGVGALATTSTLLHNKLPHLSYGGIGHPSSTYIYILLMYGIGGFMIFCAFILKIFSWLKRKIKHNGSVIDYINMAILLAACTWSLTSYSQLPNLSGIGLFWLYIISNAID